MKIIMCTAILFKITHFFIKFFAFNQHISFFLFCFPLKKTSNFNFKIKNISNFVLQLYWLSTWNKSRNLYYLNNWVYTTNHKRIAVNYFWFVILSGIIGMVLATIIRLELAYPGVGIFAGDSLQYLSMVTAHGVIMVFFMIMPLLFGAFGNFLLPTQLGVHDVAFPRLNSAAFWFLPAGLIMLGQLVCIDRRYQRMNCFNIREVQSLLKRKFFIDLINTHDYKNLINKSMISVKYKSLGDSFDTSNTMSFFNFGLENTHNTRKNDYMFLDLNDSYENTTFFVKTLNSYNEKKYSLLFNKIYVIFNENISWTAIKYNFQLEIENIFFMFSIEKSPIEKVSIATLIINPLILLIIYILCLPLTFIKLIFNFLCKIFSVFPLPDYGIFKIDEIEETIKLFNTACKKIYVKITTSTVCQYIKFQCEPVIVGLFKTLCFLKKFIIRILCWDVDNEDLAEIQRQNIEELEQFRYNFYNSTYNDLSFYSKINFNDTYNPMNFFFLFLEKCMQYRPKNFKVLYQWKAYHDFLLEISNFFSNILLPSCFNFAIDFLNIPLKYSYHLDFIKNNAVEFSQVFIGPMFVEMNSFPAWLSLEARIEFSENLQWLWNWTFLDLKQRFFPWFWAFIDNQINELKPILSEFLQYETSKVKDLSFYSDFFSNINVEDLSKNSYLEIVAQARNQRFLFPVFKYDYKAGNYFPKLYKETYTFLLSTLSDLTNALRPSVWFYSFGFTDDFLNNFGIFESLSPLTLKEHNFSRNISWVLNSDVFYGTVFSLNTENLFLSQRWIALNVLNQKFHRMYLTSSMQQRIYSNWRQLKFSREAWRCKLLAARHQKTLYRRYVNEDGVFWSIERNAKDLLPGWAMITPFSSRTRFTAVGKVDIGLMGVFLVLNSSIISGANFLVTYRYLSTLNNRKMRDARAFFAEGVMVASWMMIAANPMLVIGIIMLLSDRHWQTSFFDYSGGGDTILFQHMFWFFGHPEVYVILIPVFGFTNTILSYYLRKRVSARASLLYSMYTIAFLGFFVWGHHMYMVGLAHTTRMLFSTLTVMISVPAATKLMHWCVTLVNSSFTMELPFLFVLTFVFFFVSGGISGMFVAHTGMDILFHDTFYVIGHFHVMLAGGAMFGSFGAFYFYFPAIFGVKYSRIYAYLHYTYYLIGQLMTVIPMFWLGYAGMPRRVLDYPASMGGWHSVISAGHLLSVAGLLAFFIMIFDSLRQSKAVLRNTFGINRYNTRLNFYLYETARLIHIHQKSLYLYKFVQPNSLTLRKLNYINFEPLENTLLSYTFAIKF